MRAHRFLLPVLVLAMTTTPVALVVVASPAAATVAAADFTPALPLYDASGASTNSSEPSIHVDSHDNIYVSAPAGVPTGGCPFWNVHKDGAGYDYRGTIDTDQGSIGGGDCDISSTPMTGAYDDVSVTSLSLANLTSNVTTDGGATWTTVANSASQQAFVVDRQWQASDAALGRHYLTVHDGTANIQVSVSTDGGYQYVQNTFAIDPRTNRKALSSGVSISVVDGSNHFGALVVDPTNHHLFIPFLAPVDGESVFAEHALFISEGDPCPGGACTTPGGLPSPISWTTYQAFTAPATDNLSNDFPALTIDKAGRLYAAFTGAVTNPANSTASDLYSKSRIFVLHAPTAHTAAGAWSTPQAVDPGTGNSNVFPWLVAGSAGNVGVAWYGSVLSGTTCPGAGAKGNGTSVSDNCLNVWHVGYAQSLDADTAAPSWTASDITGDVHKGPVCNKGLNCADGTRTLLDFFDVAMDSQGRPNIAYVSDTRQLNTADVQFTRQCSGTSLTGQPLSGCGTGGTTTGGGTGGTGSTGGVAPNCFFPQVHDATGDATQVVLVDHGQSAASQADLDISDAGLSWRTSDSTLVGTVHVDDLAAAPGSSEFLRLRFKVNATAYELIAGRDNTGSEYFYWDVPGVAASSLGDLTGSFDNATNAITVELPASAYESAQPGKQLAVGSVITEINVLTQRDAGITATADSAAADAACAFAVDAADPVVPEVPYAALLPLLGVVLMGVLHLRRRTRANIA